MGWFDRFKRSTATDIPDSLWGTTLTGLPFVACRPAEELERLRRLCGEFLDRKEFTAAQGLTLSDEICLNIAVQACLPVLYLGLSAYDDWVGIIVYPNEFVVDRRIEDEDGLVHEFSDVLSGEAWPGGPVILSWQDARMAGDGYNVVIHEFAHKLDMLNGEADGIPALHSGLNETFWCDILDAAYAEFCAQVDGDEETLLDPYASEDPAEFFAVASETFFERPNALNAAFPSLYTLLSRYYRQDPKQFMPAA